MTPSPSDPIVTALTASTATAWTRLSLRARLVLLVMLAILPTLFYSAFNSWKEVDERRASRQAEAVQRTEAIRDLLDDQLRFNAAVLTTLVPFAMASEGNIPRSTLEFIRNGLPDYVSNLLVFDAQGRYVSSVLEPSPGLLKEGITDRAYFIDAILSGRLVVSDPIVGKITGSRVVNMAMPYYRTAAVPSGVVVMTINLARLEQQLNKTAAAVAGREIAVVDRNGIPITKFEGARYTARADVALLAKLKRGNTQLSEVESASGYRVLVGYSPIKRAPWIVLHASEQLRWPQYADLLREVWASLLMLPLTLILALLLARRMLRPIQQLEDGVKKFAGGNASFRFGDGLSGDFAQVATEFDRMADSLKSRQAEVVTQKDRFLQITNLTSDWYWEMDANFCFTLISQGFEKATGVSAASLIGKSRWDLPYEGLDADAWGAHRALLESHSSFRDLTIPYRLPDGSIRVFKNSGDPFFDENGNFAGYRGANRDITASHNAQARVAAAEERWVAALEAASHGVWDWNVVEGTVFYSTEWKRQLGLSDDDVSDALDELESRVHPDDFIHTKEARRRHFDGELPRYVSEHRMRCKDGRWKWILDQGTIVDRAPDGTPLRMMGTHTEIDDLKRLEAEMAEYAAMRRAIFAQSPVSMVVVRSSDRAIVDINAAFSGLFGYSREFALGKTALELDIWANVDDRERMNALLAKDGRVADLEVTFCTADRREIQVVLFADSTQASGEGMLVMQAIDISERRQAEARTRELSNRLQLATEAAQIGIWDVDFASGKLVWDATMYRIHGLAQREFSGDYGEWFGLLHDEDREAFEALFADVHAGARDFESEYRIVRPDGEVRHIRANAIVTRNAPGQAARLVGTNIDVTAQMLRERRLREVLNQMQLLLDSMPMPAAMSDPDGNLTYWNRAAEEAFGQARSEVLGRKMLDFLVAPASREKAIAVFKRLPSQNATLCELLETQTKAGRQIKSECHITPLHDDEGEFIGHLTIALDVTERIEAQRSLETINAELEQRVKARTAELSSTIKELETFSYTVAHDLRSPLRAIDGYSHVLEEETGANSEAAKWVSKIKTNVTRMATLIDDLLAYARLGRQGLETTDVSMQTLVDQVCMDLAVEYSQVTFDYAALPVVRGDASMLRQVWMNLLSNACKFSGASGKPMVRITATHHDDRVIFCVRDNGVGFDMAYASRLFGVFERLHSEQEYAGTGVGLAIVQRVMLRLGGRVWAESRPGQGAAFFFELLAAKVERNAA